MKKILVLGAGLVSRPLVRYLLDHGFMVTVADWEVAKAQEIIDGHAHGQAMAFDVNQQQALCDLVAGGDLTVSLLPAQMHIKVARCCLDLGKHMVTASYVSPEMRALDQEAQEKGLLLLNEMGVDPGIDHMSAMQLVHTEEKAGGTLVAFSSWCGGLPAPEANDNPFGYKFSWSPKGVLTAARNGARYRQGGQLVEINPDQLFATPATVNIDGVGNFEGYPNRDSVAYLKTYGFSDAVTDMFRGTLRNRGHCALYRQLIALGLFDDQSQRDFSQQTYRGLMDELCGGPVRETLPAKLGVSAEESPLRALEYIGLLDDTAVEIKSGSLMDLLANQMNKALAYQPDERDMLLMRHDLSFTYDGGQRRERVTAVMVDYGIAGGDSAMARTVSLPVAMGVRMLLEGRLQLTGVHIPILPEIYQPVLAELAELGIGFQESRQRESSGS